MSKQAIRPVNLLIAALGGEGGGVLTNWIVAAAQAQGLPVQATSIPGVAQRTGATTYYIEIWPQPVADGKRPVLSLSPAPGEVDLVATTELLEAGRCIQGGFVTPERTHLIASTSRVYTTYEKMAVGDGRFDDEVLIQAAGARSRQAHLLDLDAVARASGSRINAVLLGMLAGSGTLPIAENPFTDAIRAGGIAVDVNLKGFQAGLAAAEQAVPSVAAADTVALIAEAEARLTAYQDKAYAILYRDRLKRFDGADDDLRAELAKGLARWMAYEDIIRVAQLKTRPGRVMSLSGSNGKGDVVHITEYFRPGIRELCDILPAPVGRRILAWADARPGRLRLSWPMALRSTTVSGFLSLSVLAKLRPLRRISYRYRAEQAAIEDWFADLARARDIDPALALEIARNGRLIKGYGDTHMRGKSAFDSLRETFVVAALQGEGRSPGAMAEARKKALMERPG